MNSKKAQTLKIAASPMCLSEAIDLYQRFDDAGKGMFIECFDPDDQDLLRQALEEAGELIYTSGGLHVINGVCIATPVSEFIDDPSDPDGEYIIDTPARKYCIHLNLPLGDDYQPPNAYPKIGDRVVVKAEGIRSNGVYHEGYAEICQVFKSDTEAEEMIAANNVAVITV